MSVTRTGNKIVTYSITEPDFNFPEDRNRDNYEYFQVGFKGDAVTEIKLPHTEINYLPARTLAMLKLLFTKLESEGFDFSYQIRPLVTSCAHSGETKEEKK